MRRSLPFLIIAAVLLVTIGDSVGVDRTPIIYVSGEKVGATGLNEKGIRAMIEKALAAKPQ